MLDKDLVCPTPCELECVVGYNAGASMFYVQLFDQITAPVTSDVPEIIIPVPGGRTPFSLAISYVFTKGCAIGISTTELTYTSAGNVLSYAATVHS